MGAKHTLCRLLPTLPPIPTLPAPAVNQTRHVGSATEPAAEQSTKRGQALIRGAPKFEIKHKSLCLQKSKLVDWGGRSPWPPLAPALICNLRAVPLGHIADMTKASVPINLMKLKLIYGHKALFVKPYVALNQTNRGTCKFFLTGIW